MSSKLLEDSLKLLSLPVFTRTTLTPVLRVPCPHASKAAKSRDGTAARGSSLGKAPLDSRPKEKSPSMNAPCIPSPVLYGHTACPRHFALKEKDIISIRWCSSLGLGRGGSRLHDLSRAPLLSSELQLPRQFCLRPKVFTTWLLQLCGRTLVGGSSFRRRKPSSPPAPHPHRAND